MTSRFPDPRSARGDIIAVGDVLQVDVLRDAYRHGIFPWPHEGLPTPWFTAKNSQAYVGRTAAKTRGSWKMR